MVYANFILGFPGDSFATMQKTIDFALDMNPDVANFMIALPFPGTELYEEIKSKGRFLYPIEEGVEGGFYANRVFFEIGSLQEEEVKFYYRKAYKDFYLRLRWIWRSLKNIHSVNEIVWHIEAATELMKNIFKR